MKMKNKNLITLADFKDTHLVKLEHQNETN